MKSSTLPRKSGLCIPGVLNDADSLEKWQGEKG